MTTSTVDSGYYVWKKGQDAKISPHFKESEFSCKCSFESCIDQKIAVEIIDKLEKVRTELDMPIQVTSGYRCAAHQKALKDQGLETATGVSSHQMGWAADIKCKDINKLSELCDKYFQSVGTAKSFVHVDIREGKRRWNYNKL